MRRTPYHTRCGLSITFAVPIQVRRSRTGASSPPPDPPNDQGSGDPKRSPRSGSSTGFDGLAVALPHRMRPAWGRGRRAHSPRAGKPRLYGAQGSQKSTAGLPPRKATFTTLTTSCTVEKPSQFTSVRSRGQSGSVTGAAPRKATSTVLTTSCTVHLTPSHCGSPWQGQEHGGGAQVWT